MYYIYILESIKEKSYYIGHAEDTEKRLKRHNNGFVRSTKKARPWKIIYKEQFQTKAEAYRRELHIKSYKGGEAFKQLVQA